MARNRFRRGSFRYRDYDARVIAGDYLVGVRLVAAVSVALAVSAIVIPAAAIGQVFSYTGAEQTYTVPAGVTQVHVVVVGAPGGIALTAGGGGLQSTSKGAVVSADLPVTGGTVLYVEVGGPGMGFSTTGPTGGFNGGGSGGVSYTAGWAPGGGGASDVRTVPSVQSGSLASRLIVAGGAGGSNSPNNESGGHPGQSGAGLGGQAGSATAGGSGGSGCISSQGDGSSGGLGLGGTGGLGATVTGMMQPVGADSSGGGGGYYGGGGGGGAEDPAGFPPFCGTPNSGGGGSGSNYASPQALNTSFGLDSTGTPQVTITAPSPPTASITAPANGGAYTQGQLINSSFACAEGAGGSGLKSCLDQSGRSSGTAIDTSNLGRHTFTVTATSSDGLAGTATVTYTVAAATKHATRAAGFNFTLTGPGAPIATGGKLALNISKTGSSRTYKVLSYSYYLDLTGSRLRGLIVDRKRKAARKPKLVVLRAGPVSLSVKGLGLGRHTVTVVILLQSKIRHKPTTKSVSLTLPFTIS